MKSKSIHIYVWFLFCIGFFSPVGNLWAQDSLALEPYTQDTTGTVISYESFMDWVLQYHPIVSQSATMSDQARMEVRMARGNFDPRIDVLAKEKQLKGQRYYTQWTNELSVPLWVGQIQTGYMRNTGTYINPMDFTAPEGLSFVGLTIPIGSDMLIDQRRATLRAAQNMQLATIAEQVKEINKVLLEAAKAYWEWVYYYESKALMEEALKTAELRRQMMVLLVSSGDRAAIDSIEARMLEQDYRLKYMQAKVEFYNAGLALSSFLWKEGPLPVEVSQEAKPYWNPAFLEPLPADSLNRLLDYAKVNHPDIIKTRAELNATLFHQRQAFNKLLPKAELRYDFLAGGFYDENPFSGRFQDNQMLGFKLSYPLFLREERGKYELMQIKLQNMEWKLLQVNRDIELKLEAAFNECRNFSDQWIIRGEWAANVARLRDAEYTRFISGESSVFMVNIRDQSLWNARLSVIEYLTKYAKSKAYLQWSSGKMY